MSRHTDTLFSLGALALIAGCHASPSPKAPSAASAPPPRIGLCSDYRLTSHGPFCLQTATAEEQVRANLTHRFEYQGDLVVRRTRINGRGGLDTDDDGCVEYRYRYEGNIEVESTGYRQDGTVCDHTSYKDGATRALLVDAWNRPALSDERAFTEERYDRDERGFLKSVRFFGPNGQAINSSAGAHEERYERDAAGRELRFCYFDAQGRPINGSQGYHCFANRYDARGRQVEYRVFDVQGEPADAFSSGTHRGEREFDANGNLVVQRFFRKTGTPISAEDGSCAMVVFLYDEHGFRSGGECRDGTGAFARWRDGHSSWRASADERGHSRENRYFDDAGQPFAVGLGSASYTMEYDAEGHVIERRYFLPNGRHGQQRGPATIRYTFNARHLESRRSYFYANGEPYAMRGCEAFDLEYDAFSQVIRRSCRSADGKLANENEGVAVTESAYDTRGQLAEQRAFDAQRKPGSKSGIVRRTYTTNALGTDQTIRHFKANGDEVKWPRYRVLSVMVAQPDEFWPARDREQSLAIIERARQALIGGMPLVEALHRYGDENVKENTPGDIGYYDTKTMYTAVRAVVEDLPVGQWSEIVENPYGFTIYQRTE